VSPAMEIIVVLAVIGVVIWLARSWSGSPENDNEAVSRPGSFSNNASNNWLVYQTLQSSSPSDIPDPCIAPDVSSGTDSAQPDSSPTRWRRLVNPQSQRPQQFRI